MTEGSVVKVLSGKGKGRIFLVIRAEAARVWIADGRHRKVQHPKAKNPRHLQLLAAKSCPEPLTNRGIQAFLKPFIE